MEQHHIPIGNNTNPYSNKPVYLSREARLRQMFVIGQTGTGKTTLLQRMAIEDMLAGNGFAFFDPHGDAVQELLNYIPGSRMRDVVYLNPGDLARSFGFNILANVPVQNRDRVTQEVVSTFRYKWFDSWGARMENIFKHTVRAVLDAPARHGGATLLSIPLLFSNARYRKWVLKHSTNYAVQNYFTNEFDTWNARQLSEYVQPILNKVDQFLLSDTLRNVLGQERSTIDLEYMMNNRKILLLNLDKGYIGADDADTIGSILVTGFQLASMRRSSIAPERRTPFYCYLDEFHSFTTGSFASILSESRKYGLGLVLAGQYLDQIENQQVSSAVFGNCGNFCSFRVSNDDAQAIADTLERPIAALENLPNGQASVKYLHNGHPYTATIETELPDPAYYRGKAHQVIEYSKRYTTPIDDINARLNAWLRRINNPSPPKSVSRRPGSPAHRRS